MSKRGKSEKISDLLHKVKECIEQGKYRFSQHALERKDERFVSLPDVIEVLLKGYQEKSKDTWDERYKEWNYSIRGKTLDQEPCRIIVSINKIGLLIITVIRLE